MCLGVSLGFIDTLARYSGLPLLLLLPASRSVRTNLLLSMTLPTAWRGLRFRGGGLRMAAVNAFGTLLL